MSAAVEGTYKARDVEGLLDLYFYRRVGFRLAQAFASLGMSPTGVTVLSGISGLAAGHLYYYSDLRLNIAGMLFHVLSNTFDNADGQLARLTNTGSRNGRIIDSISDHLVFVGIYVHLALRCFSETGSPAIWLLVLAAGISHGIQGGVADYFRNAYLFFVNGGARAEFDSSEAIRQDYDRLSWRRQPWQKFLLRTYLNFTLGQERFSPQLVKLRAAAHRALPSETPAPLRERYRDTAKPVFRWIGLLMTNARMLILFALLIMGRPMWYFVVEITALNLVLGYILLKQNQLCREFLPEMENSAAR